MTDDTFFETLAIIQEKMNLGDRVEHLIYSLAMYQHVINQNKGVAPKNVLDAGCNRGYGAYQLSRGLEGSKVLGVDIDADVLNGARNIFKSSNLGYEMADITDRTKALALTEANGFFDMITCFEVFEHIPKDKSDALIENLKMVLKPGGVMFISTPNRDIYRIYSHTPDHVNEMPCRDFLNIIESYGLKIESVKGVGNHPHISSRLLMRFGLVRRNADGEIKLSITQAIFRKFIIALFEPVVLFELLRSKLYNKKYIFYRYKKAINDDPENSPIILVRARKFSGQL